MAHLEGQDDGNSFGVLGETDNSTSTAFGVWGIAAGKLHDIEMMRLALGNNGELAQPLNEPLGKELAHPGLNPFVKILKVPTAGVLGVSLLGANTAGVVGENDKEGGIGVFGFSYRGHGVRGRNGSGAGPSPDAATGVWGESDSGTGILGQSLSGRGVWGTSENFIATVGDTKEGTGVYGHSVKGTGVVGRGDENGDGVTGWSSNGSGVAGVSLHGTGIYGRSEDTIFGKAGFFEGNVTVTGDICLGNADCAEDFDVIDIRDATPGTVMVLHGCGAVRASNQAYDTRVAGVVSGAGGFRPGIILDRANPTSNRRPLALMGKVYCKVDAGYGSIGVGDLLTTSATPGHAMKVTDRTKAFGAIIGKALEGLNHGTALIPILVVLT